MYYYLSFLRPPPEWATSASSLVVTPQITNDLRTEFYEQTVDILYCWTLAGSTKATTPPAKLTTWKGSSSAYKPVTIQLPPSARPGQSWRILLFCAPNTTPSIPLGRIYAQPYGSSSLPISILSAGGASADIPKQDEIERALILPSPSADQNGTLSTRTLLIRERTSFDLDKKIWDSGIALSGWLCKTIAGNAPSEGGRLLEKVISHPGSCNVLELGAGTGLVSLTFSALLSQRPQTSVTITDLASALPLIQHNIQANSALFGDVSVTSAVLNWEEKLSETISATAPFQLLLMSDVTYNRDSFPALLKTLISLRALSRERNTGTLAILAYKERDAGERNLWQMLEEQEMAFSKMEEIPGHGGLPVELWFAQLQ